MKKRIIFMKVLIGVQLALYVVVMVAFFGFCGWAIYNTPKIMSDCKARGGNPFMIICLDKNLTKGILK